MGLAQIVCSAPRKGYGVCYYETHALGHEVPQRRIRELLSQEERDVEQQTYLMSLSLGPP